MLDEYQPKTAADIQESLKDIFRFMFEPKIIPKRSRHIFETISGITDSVLEYLE